MGTVAAELRPLGPFTGTCGENELSEHTFQASLQIVDDLREGQCGRFIKTVGNPIPLVRELMLSLSTSRGGGA